MGEWARKMGRMRFFRYKLAENDIILNIIISSNILKT